jgi:hypothetical protein
MSLAEYRSVGMSNGIPKVFAILYKEKVPLADIRTALGEESVKTALKQINNADPVNPMAIKAVMVLYRRKDTLTGGLARYYDFILGEGAKTIVSLYEDIITADKDGQWKDFIEVVNSMIGKSAAPLPVPAAAASTEPSVTSITSSLNLNGPASSDLPSELDLLPVSASKASKASTVSMADTASTASTALTASTKATKTLSLKPRAPSKSATTLTLGYKIHIKDGGLNKEKHTESMLKEQYNASAKLLVVDIDSCTEVIYPIAIDLAPESTNQDVLDYIVKVLTEATQKNLKCHHGSSLHVYTIRAWTDSARVLYVNIAK